MRGLSGPTNWSRTDRIIAAIASVAVTATLIALLAAFTISHGRQPPQVHLLAPVPPPPLPPVVALFGDSYTSGSKMGGLNGTGWPKMLATRIPMRVADFAIGGAGYVPIDPTAESFAQMLARGKPSANTALVILFGSRNDKSDPAAVGAAAKALYRQIKVVAPHAALLVIAPAWPNSQVPPAMLRNRDALKAAALQAGATFIDPLADHWFYDRPDLIGADGVHPTTAGHQYITDHIAPAVQAILARHHTA